MIILFVILTRESYKLSDPHVILAKYYQDRTYRGFNDKEGYASIVKMENQDDSTKRQLQEAKSRIEEMEKKIAILEGRIPQNYPSVKFLGHKERKRILVSYKQIIFSLLNSLSFPMFNLVKYLLVKHYTVLKLVIYMYNF